VASEGIKTHHGNSLIEPSYFEKNYNQLLLAEAWLQADKEFKHGGKRENKSKAG
jgi:hypothetical protein